MPGRSGPGAPRRVKSLSVRHMFRVDLLTRFALVLLLAAALLSSGCVALIAGGAGKPGSYPAASRSEAQATADATATSLIRTEFARDRYLKSQQISVSTYNGVVTLTGSVPGYAARSQAETIAAGIQGVRSVNNELQVTNGY